MGAADNSAAEQILLMSSIQHQTAANPKYVFEATTHTSILTCTLQESRAIAAETA